MSCIAENEAHLSPRQVHIDFHTPELPFPLGGNFNRATFQRMLLDAHVTSVTLTGRCHHGHIYYDTDLPARHPQMAEGFDFLMEQIRACHEVGIKAPVYLTAGWDAWAACRHPEWLERHEDGSIYGFEDFGQLSPGWKTLCFNTGYLDYLKEVVRDTIEHVGDELDGLFFDIVWQDVCLCEHCVEKMLAQGLNPNSKSDCERFALDTEQMFKREISQTVRMLKPDCEVVFNEGNVTPIVRPNLDDYTHFEIESLPSSAWGYRHFPATVRYAKTLGKPYLGMTARFHKGWADFGSYKNKAALEYEIFLTFAHGAACSIGDQMYPDGTLDGEAYALIGGVYERLERMEGVNRDVVAVSEIAVLHPGVVRTSEDKVDPALSGAVLMLSELGYQFDIVDDRADWTKYSVLVLPDCIKLSLCLEKKVEDYLQRGGRVLASYESGLLLDDGKLADGEKGFHSAWRVTYEAPCPYTPTFAACQDAAIDEIHHSDIVLHGRGIRVKAKEERVLLFEKQPMYQRTYQHYFGHYHAPADILTDYAIMVDSGSVGYFSHAVFEMYHAEGMTDLRAMVGHLLNRLLEGKRVLSSDMPKYSESVLNWRESDNVFVLNLLYYVPSRRCAAIDTIEDCTPLHNRHFMLNVAACARILQREHLDVLQIRNAESGEHFEFESDGENITFTVPVINGYCAIEFACD